MLAFSITVAGPVAGPVAGLAALSFGTVSFGAISFGAVSAGATPAPLYPAAGQVIFDNGLTNNVNSSGINPTDDVIVRRSPAPPMEQTTVFFFNGAVAQNATLEAGGRLDLFDATRLLGDCVVQAGGNLHLRPGGQVEGETVVEANGELNLGGGAATLGDLTVRPGGSVSGVNSTVMGNAVIAGSANLNLFRFDRDLAIEITPTTGLTEILVVGSTQLSGSGFIHLSEHRFESEVVVGGTLEVELGLGLELGGVLTLSSGTTTTIRMEGSNFGFGQVSAMSGAVVGTDRLGEPVSFRFQREAGSALRIIEEGPLGDVVCTQPLPNFGGTFSRIQVLGSPVVSDDDMTLVAFDLPANTSQFFFIGTAQQDFMIGNRRICVGGNIGRYSQFAGLTDAFGYAQLEISPSLLPGNPAYTPLPGDTVFFQCWHRDLMTAVSSNMTDAVAVTFE